MTSCFFKVLIFLVLPLFATAQVVDNFVTQPSINLSWHNNSRWSFNSAIVQRSVMENGVNALHIQAAQFASYEIGFYSQIGVGVMYRELFDKQLPQELRFTEQFVYARQYNALKIAHRVRWDQRIRGMDVTHRWRYRFSGSVPLKGGTVDARELYITTSLEAVFIAEAGETPGYDQRVAIGIGTALTKNLKLQLVTEYRWEDYTQEIDRSLFFNLGMYYSL